MSKGFQVGDDLFMWSGSHRQTCGGGRILVGGRCFLNTGSVVNAAQLVQIGDDLALGPHC